MNWDQIEGKWKKLNGRFREKWGKLTDDDLATIGGKRDKLARLLQQKYGIATEHVEKQIAAFERQLDQPQKEMNQSPKLNLALRTTAFALLLALSGAGLYACAEQKGPLERTGEKIDENVNDAKRAVEDAAD